MTNGHLDDAAISAHLDGEATSEEAAHAETCGACATRLGDLRAAAEAIGSPVALDPVARDQAIQNAIRIGRAGGGVVTPLRPRRRAVPPPWLAAAAAVLVVVALVPILGGLGGSDRDDVASSGSADDSAEESLAFDADGSDAAGGTSAPVTVDAGDVGDVDERTVRSLVEEALVSPTTTAMRGAGEGAEQEAAGDEAAGSEAAPAAEGTTESVAAPCEDAARSDFPDLLALRFRALGTYKGEEQSILAFELESGRVRVLVLAVETCGITFVQDLEPS